MPQRVSVVRDEADLEMAVEYRTASVKEAIEVTTQPREADPQETLSATKGAKHVGFLEQNALQPPR